MRPAVSDRNSKTEAGKVKLETKFLRAESNWEVEENRFNA